VPEMTVITWCKVSGNKSVNTAVVKRNATSEKFSIRRNEILLVHSLQKHQSTMHYHLPTSTLTSILDISSGKPVPTKSSSSTSSRREAFGTNGTGFSMGQISFLSPNKRSQSNKD